MKAVLLTEQQKENFASLVEYGKNSYKLEKPIIEEYINAYQNLDITKIEYFESFGKYPGQAIMNFRQHQINSLLGVTEIAFDQYGWLIRGERLFEYKEEVVIETLKENRFRNIIRLGKAKNGKWCYGYTITYGGAGEGIGINEWGNVFNNKEEALKEALTMFKAKFQKAKKQDRDRTNYNPTIIEKVLSQIEELLHPKAVQLSIF